MIAFVQFSGTILSLAIAFTTMGLPSHGNEAIFPITVGYSSQRHNGVIILTREKESKRKFLPNKKKKTNSG